MQFNPIAYQYHEFSYFNMAYYLYAFSWAQALQFPHYRFKQVFLLNTKASLVAILDQLNVALKYKYL